MDAPGTTTKRLELVVFWDNCLIDWDKMHNLYEDIESEHNEY